MHFSWKPYIIPLLFSSLICSYPTIDAKKTLKVPVYNCDATAGLQSILDSARNFRGEEVEIILSSANYDISREKASRNIYHVSNTSLIEGNTFFRIPMPSILVSDDARGWYESGPVHNLTIRNNTFIECSNPVICISPEVESFDKPVHKNILIENNRFIGANSNFLEVKATDNLILSNNTFE